MLTVSGDVAEILADGGMDFLVFDHEHGQGSIQNAIEQLHRSYREIAAVPSVDLIFIGPRDLSATLGKLNQFDDPIVRGQVEWAERAILSSGKLLGRTAVSGKIAKEMAEHGHCLIVPGSDATLLGFGIRLMLADARS